MKKILALVTALSFAVPVIADGAFAAPPGQTKPGGGGGGKPGGGGGGGGGGHKPGRPGGGGGGGGGHKPRPPGGGGGHKPRPPGNGGGHKPRPPGNGHRPRPPGNGHKPRPPGNGYRPGRPGYGGGWTRPRPNQWYWRGSWINRVRISPYVYPHGYAYRHWGVGAILPALFLTSTYFYDDVGPLGLQVPPYGYRWVRYGPDLLLVNIRTGSIEEVASGVFY